MQKKLTITIDAEVYDGLYRVVGPRKISKFIEDRVRSAVVELDLAAAYAEMAADEDREREATEWTEGFQQSLWIEEDDFDRVNVEELMATLEEGEDLWAAFLKARDAVNAARPEDTRHGS